MELSECAKKGTRQSLVPLDSQFYQLFITKNCTASRPTARPRTSMTKTQGCKQTALFNMKSDLIVDFPSSRRRSSSSAGGGGPKPKKKRVSFARTSCMMFIPPLDDYPDGPIDAREIWYSKQDYTAMKIANRQAVFDLHRRFRSRSIPGSQGGAHQTEDVDECILTGLERLLTPNTVKKSEACRRQCWDAVLDEQDRQDQTGTSSLQSFVLCLPSCTLF